MYRIDVIEQLMRLRNDIITVGLCLEDGERVPVELHMLVEDMTERVNMIHKWFLHHPQVVQYETKGVTGWRECD